VHIPLERREHLIPENIPCRSDFHVSQTPDDPDCAQFGTPKAALTFIHGITEPLARS
jgi:hypothetical protein